MYFIANWKMFGDLTSLNKLTKVIKFVSKYKKKKLKLIYSPPANLIFALSKIFKNTSIDLSAQNCHQNIKHGPHTGQINSKMIRDAGARYVILGHSENRQLGENDKLINLKIDSAIKNGLKVIFCVGETLKEKKKK